MKTKRILSGLSALTLAGLMSLTAFAQAAPESRPINPKGGTPFDVNPDPDHADTQVEFSIDPAYTVTIPAKVELAEGEEDVYTGSGKITAQSVFLHEDEKIVVTLTSASKFNLAHEGTGEYKLPYTASTTAFGKVNKETGGKVAEFPTSKTAASVDVTFTTDEVPQYAGKYRDPVVFGISVKTETKN